MKWRLWCPVPVFLTVALTLGCNGSAKHSQTYVFTTDAARATAPQTPAEQSFGLELPFLPPQHPPIAIAPEADLHIQNLGVAPDPYMHFKILAVTPEPGIGYKMPVATPEQGTDYKMLVIPEQEQRPHAIGRLEVPPTGVVPHVPGGPPIPRRPNFQQRDNSK